MVAPEALSALVNRFARNRDAYRSGGYNETQTRREFIDPLFQLLGWDVDNQQGADEVYKDVIHEEQIRVAGAHKAPDYGFRIGGARRFFVEAKKPSVNVRDDVAPAFQLRRYAWSAKLPVSILTDFEEFAVYDCRIQPIKTDSASTARTDIFRFDQYEDRWDEIEAVFSREAVLTGSLDRYADSLVTRRGTATVDDAFLLEIESWREILARDLAVRNPSLSQRELNFAVQMTIDRILFLRMAEDRGLEEYGRLEQLAEGSGIYPRLAELYRRADERYNSVLFHFMRERGRQEHLDELSLTLDISDESLKSIIGRLYYPDSPYEFSVLPVDVLGQVYEQFLGKVIHVRSDRTVEVELKPEIRRAGGVYYTPTFIVDYIVKQTIGPLLEGKKAGPRGAVSRLRILDPACGSGSFLIGAYDYLLKWHRDQYVADGPENHQRELYQGPGGQWLLTAGEKKRILLNNIYGVDIDAQAVEVTKLSLLLKVLEGESDQSLVRQLSMFHERALPDLGSNIKCGNSLIGADYYDHQQLGMFDQEERLRVNAFDWQAAFPQIMSRGFDAIIGNPPYDVLEKERGASSWPHTALVEYVRLRPEYAHALGGKLNLFRFFVIKSLDLLRAGGRFGMIVPLALLADISCARTRRELMLSTNDLLADCFPQKDNRKRRVFSKAKLSTVVITAERDEDVPKGEAGVHVRVFPWNSFADPYRECEVRLADTALLDPVNTPIPLTTAEGWSLARKIHSSPRVMRLGDVRDFEIARGEINQTVYRRYISSDSTMARLLKGVEVGRYQLHSVLSQGEREWFDEAAFLLDNSPRHVVQRPRIATQRITGVDERLRIVGTLIQPPTYFADSTNSIVLDPTSPYRLEYLLGLLNSQFFQWRFKLTSTNNNVGTNELESMPFRVIDFADPVDRQRHDRMVGLVEQLLRLNEQEAASRMGHDKAFFSQQIAAIDGRIEELVFRLYDLGPGDILTAQDSQGRDESAA